MISKSEMTLFERLCLKQIGGQVTNLAALIPANYKDWHPRLRRIERAGIVCCQHRGPGRKLVMTLTIWQLSLGISAEMKPHGR